MEAIVARMKLASQGCMHSRDVPLGSLRLIAISATISNIEARRRHAAAAR